MFSGKKPKRLAVKYLSRAQPALAVSITERVQNYTHYDYEGHECASCNKPKEQGIGTFTSDQRAHANCNDRNS